jgi:hypothetical protein
MLIFQTEFKKHAKSEVRFKQLLRVVIRWCVHNCQKLKRAPEAVSAGNPSADPDQLVASLSSSDPRIDDNCSETVHCDRDDVVNYRIFNC